MDAMNTKPAPVPRRVAMRPDPAQWSPDEVMSLIEAAALYFPDGPLSITSLRNAVRKGDLGISVVAGKYFTTPAAIAEMLRPTPHGLPEGAAAGADPPGVRMARPPPKPVRARAGRNRLKLEAALARSPVQR